MNTLPAIMTAILAVLRVDHGTFDLSDDNQVQEGTFDKPVGSVAFAGVCPAELLTSEPWGRGPDWYDETYAVEIRLWAPVANATTGDRVVKGRLLSAEVKRSLDNAKAGANNTIWRTWQWVVRTAKPDPASPTTLPGYAHERLRLEFMFKRASGTGV